MCCPLSRDFTLSFVLNSSTGLYFSNSRPIRFPFVCFSVSYIIWTKCLKSKGKSVGSFYFFASMGSLWLAPDVCAVSLLCCDRNWYSHLHLSFHNILLLYYGKEKCVGGWILQGCGDYFFALVLHSSSILQFHIHWIVFIYFHIIFFFHEFQKMFEKITFVES